LKLPICELMEENISAELLVSTYAAGVIHEIMQKEGSGNGDFIQQLLDINKPKDDIKNIEGTNFGCPIIGFYDYPLILLEKLYAIHISESSKSKSIKSEFSTSLGKLIMQIQLYPLF